MSWNETFQNGFSSIIDGVVQVADNASQPVDQIPPVDAQPVTPSGAVNSAQNQQTGAVQLVAGITNRNLAIGGVLSIVAIVVLVKVVK